MNALLFGSISSLADTSELQREAFNAAFEKNIVGSGLPGAPYGSGGAGGSSGGYDSALTPMDEDDRPAAPRSKSARRQVISDDEYMTQSDEE